MNSDSDLSGIQNIPADTKKKWHTAGTQAALRGETPAGENKQYHHLTSSIKQNRNEGISTAELCVPVVWRVY